MDFWLRTDAGKKIGAMLGGVGEEKDPVRVEVCTQSQ
jgi:hypothetical protein